MVSHVGGRGKVLLLDILQLVDQRLLRVAARTGIPLNRALVDHDREAKAGVGFGFGHDHLCCLVLEGIRTVPIDDHAINAAADHVGNLTVDLCRISGTVAHVHVVRLAKPQHQMRVDFGLQSGTQQGVDIQFTDVSNPAVAI